MDDNLYGILKPLKWSNEGCLLDNGVPLGLCEGAVSASLGFLGTSRAFKQSLLTLAIASL